MARQGHKQLQWTGVHTASVFFMWIPVTRASVLPGDAWAPLPPSGRDIRDFFLGYFLPSLLFSVLSPIFVIAEMVLNELLFLTTLIIKLMFLKGEKREEKNMAPRGRFPRSHDTRTFTPRARRNHTFSHHGTLHACQPLCMATFGPQRLFPRKGLQGQWPLCSPLTHSATSWNICCVSSYYFPYWKVETVVTKYLQMELLRKTDFQESHSP